MPDVGQRPLLCQKVTGRTQYNRSKIADSQRIKVKRMSATSTLSKASEKKKIPVDKRN